MSLVGVGTWRGTGKLNEADLFSFSRHLQAPIIALYADLSTPVPIYVSGVLFVVSGFIACLLPFEPRGRASI